MTREKAFEILDKFPRCTECDGSFPYNCDECDDAFLTAFDALKQPERKTGELTAFEQIQQKATEEADRFIFETIQPFCSQVTQREIRKTDLEQALIHYFPKERIKPNGGVFFECPTCGDNYVTSGQKFCDNCGQHLK